MEMKIAKNENFNSFEIVFDGKPGEKIREILKANGYRWHKARGLWYGYKDLREILTTATGEQLNEQDKPEKTDEQPARVPTIKPLRIFYNGVKIDGGALIKIGIWTNGEKITLSAGSLPRGYGLEIENDSDPYRDYFADDYAEIYPDYPLYKFFKAAALKYDYIRKAKAFSGDIKYFNRRPALCNEQIKKALTEKEKRVDEAREIAESNDCGQPTAADLLAVEDYIEKKKAEREAAEREQREQDERARRAYNDFCRDVVEKKTKAFPLTDSKNYVKILWSECSAIDKISEEQTGDGRISLTAADEIFAEIDYYMHTNRENSPAIGWYDKTKFSIIRDGEIVETARIDLGDGDGGLHSYFMALAKWSATHDENGREKPEEVDDETMDFLQWLGAAILAPKADADKQAEQQTATEEQATESNTTTEQTRAETLAAESKNKKGKEKRVADLVAALIRAKTAAKEYENSEDGGTCNFDSPVLWYKTTKAEADRLGKSAELTAKDVEEAVKRAGLTVWKWNSYGSPSYVIGGYGASGQGNRRTRMAEAFSKSLTASGYGASVYYQMD